MSRIQIPNAGETLKRKAPPEEIYDAEIGVCDGPRESRLGGQEVMWGFRIDGTPSGLEDFIGVMVFQNTSIEPNQGDQYLQFTGALGLDPEDFDTEDAVGMKCKVRCTQREGKNRDTGEKVVYSNIATVFPPDA